MEVASAPQPLGDSFSCGWLKQCGTVAPAPSLDADLGSGLVRSFGSSRSFIDMDPAVLFSMRWTTTTALPATDSGDSPSAPTLVSASQIMIILEDRLLLPCELITRPSGLQQQHEDRITGELLGAPRLSTASSPPYHSAQSTAASMSTWSIAGNNKNNSKAPSPLVAGRRSSSGSGASSCSRWKILLRRYLRFLMPMYRKVRALRRLSAPRPSVGVAPASPASLEWCHGNADTAVRDAILYCKKSSEARVRSVHRSISR